MIIENQAMVTDAVVEAVSRAEDPRLREILLSLVRHLHGFVREVRLTEREFQEAVGSSWRWARRQLASHNEVVLMAGSLGVSSLVCLLNNGNNGQTETQANMLGPFWRDDQPSSATAIRWCAHRRRVRDLSFMLASKIVNGRPVAGAEIDVWHSSPEGLYENQDPKQAEMNLRGRFISDEAGRFHFRSVKPRDIPFRSTGRSETWCGPPVATTTGPRICISWCTSPASKP